MKLCVVGTEQWVYRGSHTCSRDAYTGAWAMWGRDVAAQRSSASIVFRHNHVMFSNGGGVTWVAALLFSATSNAASKYNVIKL